MKVLKKDDFIKLTAREKEDFSYFCAEAKSLTDIRKKTLQAVIVYLINDRGDSITKMQKAMIRVQKIRENNLEL